ncbi:MAG: Rrf2 family transcriptional regulator [Candidatus Kapabacteria bacterium]|nr:Rrf2 family transcriptional regulator [Candidatus Kapabacteria bacterium]
MFRLSKKVEYGILSMQYLADKEEVLVSAKEMSESLEISSEFLSKTLQLLMKKGLVISQKGIKGGYLLSKPSNEISMSDIIYALDSKPELVGCNGDNGEDCDRKDNCTIRKPLEILQIKLNDLFELTKLSELKSNENKFVKIDLANVK